MTHTRGPWTAAPHGVAIITAADGQEIGMAFRALPNARANANLMAAAPDLLEALENLIQRVEFLCEAGRIGTALVAIADARAAIAKAKGEP